MYEDKSKTYKAYSTNDYIVPSKFGNSFFFKFKKLKRLKIKNKCKIKIFFNLFFNVYACVYLAGLEKSLIYKF